jgi:DNA-binding CsgD family transcriptional regulator
VHQHGAPILGEPRAVPPAQLQEFVLEFYSVTVTCVLRPAGAVETHRPHDLSRLTNAGFRVYKQLELGKSDKIADELGITASTVHFHNTNIYEKLGILRSQRDPVKKPLLARTVFLLDLRDSEIDFALLVFFLLPCSLTRSPALNSDPSVPTRPCVFARRN